MTASEELKELQAQNKAAYADIRNRKVDIKNLRRQLYADKQNLKHAIVARKGLLARIKAIKDATATPKAA